jgi:ABC-type spermidine/putrescine transport system permease subunit I
VSVANGRLDELPAMAAVSRAARLATLPNILLVACVVVAVWLVFVPLSALLYNAFTEDTGFGPGALSLDNFVEAYSSWHILRLFWNSLVFALGTAVTTFVMGALVAWAVERTDAPGASLFHTLSLLSFAVPGLLMAMAWIFVFSPNIGWGNAVLKSAFGLGEAPVNIYSMAGMTWALSSHYFPLAYLALGPALRVLDVRMEEAALMSGGNYSQVFTRVTLPLLRPAILSALLLLFVMGMASYEVPRLIGRPARIDVFTTDIQGAIIATPAGIRGRERARPHAARDLRPGRLLLPPRNETRGILRHHHRQGLPADARQARALALAGRARHRRHVRPGARPAAAHAGLAVVLPQPRAAVLLLRSAGHARQL